MGQQDQYLPKKDQWTSKTYEKAASFVPQLTTKVLQLLNPQPNDRILDVGCGDGKFTSKFIPMVKEILGVDASEDFVRSANEEFRSGLDDGGNSNVRFKIVDCRFLEGDAEVMDGAWDKVVSNAALHWILRDPDTRLNTLKAIHTSLRPGGTFVFEMGGAGNVAECLAALTISLHHIGGLTLAESRQANPWWFPSEIEMRSLMLQAGFQADDIEVLELEYRPTKLTDRREGPKGGGLEGWVRLMGASMLQKVTDDKRNAVVEEVCEALQDVVGRDDGSEWLGYVRLRGLARKRSD